MDGFEAELRKKFERRLGRQIPDEVWKDFCSDNWPNDVERGDETEDTAFRKLQNLMHIYDAGREAGRRDRSPPRKRELPPDRRTILRARLLAQAAERDPLVRHFRDRVLSGRLLRPEEVESWIRAQAEQESPPSRLLMVPLPPEHKVIYDKEARAYRIDPPITLDTLPHGASFHSETLEYIIPQSEVVQFIPVKVGGVLDRLRRISEWLSGRFGWQKAQATNFVLTGRVPVASPLTISTPVSVGGPIPTVRIVLDVDPEVSPERVKQEYQQVRKQVRGGKRRYHPLSKTVMDLVEFVLDHPDLSWRDRFAAWNREHPERSYSSPQSLSNVYHRAARKILSLHSPLL